MLNMVILALLSRFKIAGGLVQSSALHYQIRCARLGDINHIDECNRATLPENYQRDFYESHLQTWPELALVALNSNKDVVILFRFNLSNSCPE